jgi:hypothetical protein
MASELPPELTRGSQAIQNAEDAGRRWENVSIPALVGSSTNGNPETRSAVSAEMQRRLMVAQRESNEIQKRLITAIESSGDCASEQTEQVIRLTNSLKVLTWVLVGVGVVQVALMLWKG